MKIYIWGIVFSILGLGGIIYWAVVATNFIDYFIPVVSGLFLVMGLVNIALAASNKKEGKG